jgi:hypothetical protein
MRQVFVGLASLCWALAGPLGAAEEPIIIPIVTDPSPVIDGNLSEWTAKGVLVEIATPDQVTYNRSAWKSPADLSGWVRFGHNGKCRFPRFVETADIGNLSAAHLFTPIASGDHVTERNEVDSFRWLLRALDWGGRT